MTNDIAIVGDLKLELDLELEHEPTLPDIGQMSGRLGMCFFRSPVIKGAVYKKTAVYIVGSRGASQLGGSLLGIPPGYLH